MNLDPGPHGKPKRLVTSERNCDCASAADLARRLVPDCPSEDWPPFFCLVYVGHRPASREAYPHARPSPEYTGFGCQLVISGSPRLLLWVVIHGVVAYSIDRIPPNGQPGCSPQLGIRD